MKDISKSEKLEAILSVLAEEYETAINETEKLKLTKLVRRFGDLNTDALLDSHCLFFSIPSIEGFIGYRLEAKCAVVFGDPVCTIPNQPLLAEAFQKFCKKAGLNVIYVIASEQFANALINEESIRIQFGNKLLLQPSNNPSKRTGSKAVLVRKKVKHALNDGVTIHEYLNSDPEIEKVITTIGDAWLDSRHGPQVYIAHLDFFNDCEGKRWFYAKQQGRIVGFLILNQIQASNGWLLNNLIITPDAPSGSSELLITAVLEILEKEECENVIIGPVAAGEIPIITGLGPFTSKLVHLLFQGAKHLFSLDGQAIFWEKFQPNSQPSYVIFDKLNFRTLRALLRALNVKYLS